MYNNELYHYGVKGMRWGVRKERAPSPRTLTKRLNKLDQKRTDTAVRYMTNDYKARKYANKAASAKKIGKVTKAAKLTEKGKVYSNKSKIFKSKMKEIESSQQKIIGEAAANKYLVFDKQIKRMPTSYKRSVYLIGALPSIALYSYQHNHIYKNDYDGDSPYAVKGKKFKVRKIK